MSKHIYQVQYSEMGKIYSKSKSINIIASNLMDAAIKVEKNIGGATVWTVSHKGLLTEFDDD